MQAAEARPPYVVFEVRAVEDREASIEAGHYVAKDVAYAIITPQGSKDRIERVVKEWFEQLEQQVMADRFPREWLSAYKGAFRDWQEGHEPAVNGTDVRNWPAASPAQVKLLLDFKIRTVEDLASANEEAIGRLGMGGRALKARACEWLASAKDSGKQAEALAALRAENADLKARNDSLEARVVSLTAKVEALGAPAKKS